MNSRGCMSVFAACAVIVVLFGSTDVCGKEEVTVVTREQLVEAMKSDRPPVVVNVLSREQYLEKRIPGSISLPTATMAKLAEAVLPARNTAVVVYCSSSRCSTSANAARRLMAMGYTEVSDYKGGIKDWEDAGLPLERGGGTYTVAENKVRIRPAEESALGKSVTCPVNGKDFKVVKATLVAEYQGNTYYFCCPGCDTRFSSNPEKYTGKAS